MGGVTLTASFTLFWQRIALATKLETGSEGSLAPHDQSFSSPQHVTARSLWWRDAPLIKIVPLTTLCISLIHKNGEVQHRGVRHDTGQHQEGSDGVVREPSRFLCSGGEFWALTAAVDPLGRASVQKKHRTVPIPDPIGALLALKKGARTQI